MTTPSTPRGERPGVAIRLEGSLTNTAFSEILRKITSEERSGDLLVSGPSFAKTIYFDRGFVVFASSNRKMDRLGESMIEAGRISRHEFALASMLMKSTNQKFGAVLVEAGIVPEEELGRFVAAQVNRIVLSLFLAKQGTYKFEERPCSIPVDLMVSLSVYRILLEGVRRMSRKSLVLQGLPSLDTEVKIVDPPPFNLDVDKLRAEEKSVLRAAQNGATLQDIVDVVEGHEGVTLRALYGLVCGGILEPVERKELDPKRRLLQVQEETGTFVLSDIRHKVQPPAEPVETPAPVIAAPAPSPPTPVRVEPEPARPQSTFDHVSVPVETSDGFTLGDIYDFFERAWNTIRGWFGDSSTSSPPEREQPQARTQPRPTRTPERRPARPDPAEARAQAPAPAAETPKVENVGVPSWSVKDDPAAQPDDETRDKSVGTPSWSLKSDEAAAPIHDEGVGVPKWSAKDPNAHTPPPVAVEQELDSEPESAILEPPSWSIADVPEPPEDEVLDTSQALDVDNFDEEPLPDLDNEFFIESEPSSGDEISMLRQIPVENVELSQDLELELDVELEEEDELAHLPQTGEMVREPIPEPPAEPPKAETPAPSPKPPPKPKPPEPQHAAQLAPSRRETDYEIEEDDDKQSSYEQEMRRMKQSGGEARLLRDVKLHFRMRDWKGAVPLLGQLIAISPGKALYRGMLARALSRDPVRRKDAEEHFVEALRLSPRDPELHYWLGLYYKSFGLQSRAITEFRTTLRINSQHEGARKQLGAGKKDDGLGSVFKKIFG